MLFGANLGMVALPPEPDESWGCPTQAGFAWVGVLTLGFLRRDKSKVNYPTLTSNSTTLGWGTLEILPGTEPTCTFVTSNHLAPW